MAKKEDTGRTIAAVLAIIGIILLSNTVLQFSEYLLKYGNNIAIVLLVAAAIYYAVKDHL